jgi:hypothetical protein
MERVATRRLIDAAASLDAADRALVNLWVNRGLDDAAVARMTGTDPSAIAERRGRIVMRLGTELGLPPDQVAETLETLAASDDRPTATGAGEAEAQQSPEDAEAPAEAVHPSSNGHAPTPESVIATAEIPVAPTTAANAPGEGTATDRTRRRQWAWIPALLAAALVVAVVVIVAGGSSPKHHRTITAVQTHTVPPAPVTPTSSSPPPTVSRPPTHPLAALPGGVSRARGAVFLSGRRHHLKLRLTVIGLPAARGGHYEVWLYNTVIQSQPLARLRSGVRHLLIRLPNHAARFHWIDISFQPAGVIYHSGESILRAANPVRTSPRKLRRRSARRRPLRRAERRSARRRQLRRATKGSKRAIKSK